MSASRTKRTVLLLCVVTALASALVALMWQNKPAGAATDQLPDLQMAKLSPIYVCPSSNTAAACSTIKMENQQLRFGAKIANTGAGKFEVRGSRSSTADPTMGVTQRIYDSVGGFRDVPTGAAMYYSAAKAAGDGHNHWHLKNLETYTLTRLDGTTAPRGGNKQGFCFYDNTNWGSSSPAFYTQSATNTGLSPDNSCAKQQPSALQSMAGLSRGWADNYGWNTVGQSITIAGLPDGDYRITATADEAGLFQESDESNNSTYVDVRLRGIGTNSATVTVLADGPSAPTVN